VTGTRRPVVIAHRGASRVAPENTMVAFRRALDLGADGIELDVHETRDGALVVMHDFTLTRTTGAHGFVHDHDAAYVRRLDAGSWFDLTYARERVPLLAEVLDLRDCEFEIELKGCTASFVDSVVRLVVERDLLRRVEFTSSHPFVLARVKATAATARIGLFSRGRLDWMPAALHERLVEGDATLGHFDVVHVLGGLLSERFVRRLHDAGFLVHAPDVNTQERIEVALEAGVDRLSTDDVALALALRDEYR
jgi:glycerophosphoryl diester phosphodiesterase